MTTISKRDVLPALDKVWKTFVSTAGDIKPHETIRTNPTRFVPPDQQSLPITPSALPQLPIQSEAAPDKESSATDFEVTGVLGEGGMGRVLLARQRSLQRDVALKVLKDDSKRDVIDTLLAEAIITGSIEHPSIVPVHALGRDSDGRPVLVMKRIEGVSWRNLVKEPDHPAWSSLALEEGDKLDAHLEIFMSVCNAAHYAHTRGVIHRDIKLENVMIGGFGEVYLVDWGIAMRIQTPERDPKPESFSSPVGTLAYMAPEMAVGNEAFMDARTDVYLLGATLHFILTGTPRHQADTVIELLFAARDSEPVEYGPEVPSELAAICNKATHVDPDKRFQTALELRTAILSFRRHRGSIALADKARKTLNEADQFIAQHGLPAVGSDEQRRMVKWMTESRFGFMQALDAWRGNQAARDGLDHCLERQIDYEIRHRSVAGARALLSELSVPRPDLEKRIEELAQELNDAKAREKRLEALERDVDLRIGARFQLVIIAVIPAALALAFFILRHQRQDEVTQRQLILFPFVVLAMFAIAFLAVRKRLTTAISRRFFALLFLFPLATLTHRLLAVMHGTSTAAMLTTDLVIMAIVAASLAITIMPQVGLLVAVLLGGSIAVTQFPAHATNIFMITAGIAAVFIAALWTRLTSRKDA